MTTLLGELGISHVRLVMPTKENIQHLEGLLDAAGVLIDTKKAVDRIDQEIRTQKKLLGLVGENDEADGGEEEDEGGGEKETAEGMEVDREASAGEAERQVRGSGSKTKEGTSDKGDCKSQSHKRSLSISSVETSGTRASRSNKRVRRVV